MTTSLRFNDARGATLGANDEDETPRVTVLSVGYLVLDVITTTRVVGRNAGGTAGNVAANLAWLGQRSALLARIGNDHAGELLGKDLAGAGVDTTHLHRNADVETPILIQKLTDTGPQYLFSCPVCNYKFASHRPATRAQAEEAAASDPKMLFVDRASKAALDLMGKVKAEGGIVMFEPNGPGRHSMTAEAISLADVLKVSEDRVPSLGTLLHKTPKQQVQVRTLGAKGLEFRVGEGPWHSRRAQRVRVTDSAGAGDWVTAGLLAHLADDPRLTHRNISDALSIGQALAALSCTFLGARGMNSTLTWREASGLLERSASGPWNTSEAQGSGAQSTRPPLMRGKASTHGCAACGSRLTTSTTARARRTAHP